MPSHAEIRQKRCETLQCRIVMEAQTENNNEPNVKRTNNGSQTKKSKEIRASEQKIQNTRQWTKQLKYTNYTTIATI